MIPSARRLRLLLRRRDCPPPTNSRPRSSVLVRDFGEGLEQDVRVLVLAAIADEEHVPLGKPRVPRLVWSEARVHPVVHDGHGRVDGPYVASRSAWFDSDTQITWSAA